MRSMSHGQRYGAPHQAQRKRWAKFVATGEVCCARCGLWIQPGEPWDLGHQDHDLARWSGPEHRRCNRRTSTHASNGPRGTPL